MQRAMRPWKRIVILAGLVALAPVLAGCADMDMDKLDVFHLNDKKPIPGERKPVFPNGVPGVTQGIPPEYLHPNQPPQDAALATPPVQQANNPPALAPAAAAAPPNASRTASVEPHNIVPESDAPKHKPKPKPKAKTEHKPKPKPTQVTVRPSPSSRPGRRRRPSRNSSSNRERLGPITAKPPTTRPGRRRHRRAISSAEAKRLGVGACRLGLTHASIWQTHLSVY